LLLISPDFVNSDNCYNQAEQAMARYESGEAKVIPILLSPVNWPETSFGKLRPLPINEQPISSWTSQGLSILPRNFDTAKSADQLIHESTAPTIRTLLRQAGVPETKFEKEGTRIPQGSKKSWEWIGPIIFIGQEMLNDVAVPIMLNVISSYLYDIFKGHRHDAEVTLEYVVETVEQTNIGEKREYKRITFKGTPNDLKAFDVNMLKQLTRKTTK
jgi:hypothetical protein